MCVLHTAEQVHVCIPQLEVSVGAAGHKHLATWGEAAGHHTGLADLAAPVDNSVRDLILQARGGSRIIFLGGWGKLRAQTVQGWHIRMTFEKKKPYV